jgi:hypothetical protein
MEGIQVKNVQIRMIFTTREDLQDVLMVKSASGQDCEKETKKGEGDGEGEVEMLSPILGHFVRFLFLVISLRGLDSIGTGAGKIPAPAQHFQSRPCQVS